MNMEPQRFWDHAYANGFTFTEPKRRWSPLDWLFRLGEYLYGRHAVRRCWKEFRDNAVLGADVRLGCGARILNKASREAVRIGDNVVIRGIIRIEPGGQLDIGENCYIGDDVIISAAARIRIGRGTLLAHGAQVFDNPAHPLDWREREEHYKMLLGLRDKFAPDIPRADITIGENCWIGMGGIVLTGVSLGDRAIVGAGTVVAKPCPQDAVMVGASPRTVLAKAIREKDKDD
jgi:acetyltransferase-like isoleucine patch superfamily enzyme